MNNEPDPALFYQHHVFCCTNRREEDKRISCAAGGAEVLRAYMKDKVKQAGVEDARVNTAGCLNRCELGPVMAIYPEGVWYSYRTKDDIDEIVATHLLKGGRVKRLMLTNDAD
jgi:(2Fe-2S) ferredoxin